MRRYAITSRTLFPLSPQTDDAQVRNSQNDKTRVHSSQSHSDGGDSQTDKTRVPHPSQSYREGWDSQHSAQLEALIHQTALWAADGIDYIQFREKDLPSGTLAALARRILEALRNTQTKLLINSRPDVAIATAAHGVHLTSSPGQLTPTQVREIYAATLPPPVISISCHTLAEVEHARHHADLILFSPIFHKSVAGQLITPGQGLEALHAAVLAAAPTPVYALGGITRENAPACLEAGAAGIAGIRLFHGDGNSLP